MSKVEVNQISSQCGSTLTIGQSGDTVTLACGATQSGFGRSGSVNWDTTAKTSAFTAVSGNGYFVNTTSGAVTMTLPATPSAGDIVAVADYARTFATNNLTVARNGSNIQGEAFDGTFSTNGQSTTFVYVDGTKGWVPTEDQTTANYGASYIVATGGTVTCCGDYKIHTFTSPGTFTVCSVGNPAGSDSVDYLVIAGGGGGGENGGAGGGAGGYRESSGAASGCYSASPLGACVSALPVTTTGYPITVGGGGAGAPNDDKGGDGSNSVFSTITSTGGGGGSGRNPSPGIINGGPGGSGGGGQYDFACSEGTGNTPPVSPPQGNPGGLKFPATNAPSGGGGGAGAAGQPTCHINGPATAGTGGCGVASSITGSSVTRGGGGGGGGIPSTTPTMSLGGPGGGGRGHIATVVSSVAGTANTGGGGGGGMSNCNASSGGSGIVIIRYKYQ